MRLRKEYQIADLFDFKNWKEVSANKLTALVPRWYGF